MPACLLLREPATFDAHGAGSYKYEMIELLGVSKSFDATLALGKTDLVVDPGKTTVLIGPSGCGKSTLLRLIIGLLRPDAGSVVFEGTQVSPQNIPSLRRKRGYVIQDGGLFPHLSAERNVSLMARHLKWTDDRIQRRVAELTELTRFPRDGLDRYPAQLSGGQRQRVSLMRSLMLDPDVLLLDEPLGSLDPMIRSELKGDLRSIFRTLGKTVLMVTHDIGEAGFFGDTIVLMRDGRIVQTGSLAKLVHSPCEPFVTDFVNAQRSPLEQLRSTES